MTTQIKRKLYKRGSSFETTIPMPLLFALDRSKKHNVLFNYDAQNNRWFIEFEEEGVRYPPHVKKKSDTSSGKMR